MKKRFVVDSTGLNFSNEVSGQTFIGGQGRLFEKPHRRGDAMQKNEQKVGPFSEKLDFQ